MARPTLALAAAALLACRAAGPEPPAYSLRSSFEPIPDVELTTHEGRRVRFYEDLVRGRTVAIQFFYTRCQGTCPLSTQKLLQVQEELGERLGRDVFFLSLTLDPERDTPEILAEHARESAARSGWTFLTGAQEDIDALRRRLGVYDLDPLIDADRSQHAGVVVLGNDLKQRWTMQPATLPASFLCQSLLRLAQPAR